MTFFTLSIPLILTPPLWVVPFFFSRQTPCQVNEGRGSESIMKKITKTGTVVTQRCRKSDIVTKGMLDSHFQDIKDFGLRAENRNRRC
jgi:hypothetical protein